MQGMHAEVTKRFAKSNENYIITSRIIQSRRDLAESTAEERADVVGRWTSGAPDHKSLERLRRRDTAAQRPSPASSSSFGLSDLQSTITGMGARSGWMGKLSFLDERLRQDRAKSSASRSEEKKPATDEDTEFEKAILASVNETSRGNAEEDAAIEQAIRESVNAVRERGELPEPVKIAPQNSKSEKDPTIFEDKEYQITDEEYRDLIEQAIRESMGSPEHVPQESGVAGLASDSQAAPAYRGGNDDDDDDLKRAIAESQKNADAPPAYQQEAPNDDGEDELRRAIEASRTEADKETSDRKEEDIVMDYIKKQSLAEEEYRQKRLGKGKQPDSGHEGEDADLERALQESLKLSGGGSGGSGSGTR